jgi:hypothetical protein
MLIVCIFLDFYIKIETINSVLSPSNAQNMEHGRKYDFEKTSAGTDEPAI